jgi:hypothetical protein
MTDRELLKWAAKAIGIDLVFDPYGVARNCSGMHEAMNVYCASAWNPLDHNDDALRMAVKLNLQITIEDKRFGVVAIAWGDDFNVWVEELSSNHESALAGTRRAIVRAAAEIGKAIPSGKSP